ncbi:NAC domain-containing protein 83-like [Dioscorea cayenensis subsp. rotundata]|uniref:NAC domain-containing protein 83-like n=1 Tax=Dioscorea cayennensis subsp. rotundata TaxID=55577 RepID=A0AB40AXF2_DIOCR|nr:NAC domain-containing protein 83-like [Dioscorea cayenensis subsp. rotundata]
MENSSFCQNRIVRLPPGFRFHPTDEELVDQYLKRKALGLTLPSFIIPEIDLSEHDPWDLPGPMEQEKYFFNLREAKYRTGSRNNRKTISGYWKATGRDKPVVISKNNQVVGMKKVLVFYKGKPLHGSKTIWIMHEYRLNSGLIDNMNSYDWVLCRIFMKKRATKMEGKSYIDFVRPCSSPESSCVTDVGGDLDDTSSRNIA